MGKIKIILVRKKRLVLFFVVIVMIFAFGELTKEKVKTTLTDSDSKPTVVIDPGHGGVDSGALFEGILEKDITLDISLYIKTLLQENNISHLLTRDEDVDLGGEFTKGRHRRDLVARREIINRGKLAVSIHVNTIDNINEEGAVIFYAQGSKEGEKLADCILTELGKVQKLNYPQPIPNTSFFLLRTSNPPVVLVELGFLSNKNDRLKLTDNDFRKKCAQAIVKGIKKYLENVNQD